MAGAAQAAQAADPPLEPLGSAMVYEADVRCPACEHTWKDPVTVTCGHTLCKDCIPPLIHVQDGGNIMECPACDRTCDLFEDHAINTTARAVLRKTQRLCTRPNCAARATPWDGHICPWPTCTFCKVGAPDMAVHLLEECAHLPCVGYQGCGWRGDHAAREAHRTVCSAARLVTHLQATGVLTLTV